MNIDKKALIGIITEIEASRERAKGETRHQSDILKKAKEQQFDTKAIRKVLHRRAMSEGDRESLDIAIDTYERAMGSLASAQEAVDEGRMTGREAAEHYSVPRGALAVVTRGAKNAISEPVASATTHSGISQGDAERGESDGEARGVSGNTDGVGGDARRPSVLQSAAELHGRDGSAGGETWPAGNATGGDERSRLGAGRPSEDAAPARVAAATPSVGAVGDDADVTPTEAMMDALERYKDALRRRVQEAGA